MGSPGIRGDFVFAPTGVPAGLGVHFEKNKIGETALAETPRGAESCDSAAHYHNRNFFNALCSGKRDAVA